MPTADGKRPVASGRKREALRPQRNAASRQRSTRSPSYEPPPVSDPRVLKTATQAVSEQARNAAMMRMLATIRDCLAPGISPLHLFRAAALCGLNANPETAGLDPGVKALNADQDAQALLEVAADDPPGR